MNDITITPGMVNEINVVELMRNAVIDGEDAVIFGFKTFEEIQGELEVGGCVCLCGGAFVKCVNRGLHCHPICVNCGCTCSWGYPQSKKGFKLSKRGCTIP